MKTLNKSLLAAAIVGAIALPGLSSAATVAYVNGTQLTFARDLIVNDSRTIRVPDGLRITAIGADDIGDNITNINTVSLPAQAQGPNGREILTVKVTLVDNLGIVGNDRAAFSGTGLTATQLVGTFTEGVQTGGNGNVINVIANSAQYSADGYELTFQYEVSGNGNTADPGYFLEINSFQMYKLMRSLGNFGSVSAEITIMNGLNQPVLAGKTVVARSQWGLDVVDLPQPAPEVSKRIDVQTPFPNKRLYSPSGSVGGSHLSNVPVIGSNYYNAGGFRMFVQQAALVGGNTDFVNDFNAKLASPYYNLVNNSIVTVAVTGEDFTSFAPAQIWLDQSPTCAKGNNSSLTATGLTGTVATFTAPTSTGIWGGTGVADAPPSNSDIHVCFGTPLANTQIEAQALSGTVSVDYNLSTQRVNPAPWNFALAPLQTNGATHYFQNVNPGSNLQSQSLLRFTNHNASACKVTVDAKDDLGRLSGAVKFTVAAHASEQFNIDRLEDGNDARITNGGSFRTGAGKWYVRSVSECTNFSASALIRSNGTLSDMTAQRGVLFWSTPTISVP